MRALLITLAIAAASLPAQVIPQETEFRAKLLSPVDTETSKKGDKLTAQVTAPPAFAGDILEGQVRESKGGAKVKGNAVLNLAFETLNHAGQRVPIQASVKSVVNSQGKQDVDEEGRVVRKKNSLGKAAVGAGIGALIGGIAGGGKGAAIGAAAGAGAALVLIEVAAEGARVSFAAGSEFVLAVKQRQ
jgi:hypothetical protein